MLYSMFEAKSNQFCVKKIMWRSLSSSDNYRALHEKAHDLSAARIMFSFWENEQLKCISENIIKNSEHEMGPADRGKSI